MIIRLSLHGALTPPSLESERCIMRPLCLHDAPAIFLLASDPQIARYTAIFGPTPHQSLQETKKFIQRCLTLQQNNYGMIWVILEKYSNAIIGMMSLFGYSSAHKKAEFGYVLSPSHWGHGIMTEISKLLTNYAFTELCLVRLQATVDPENIGSIRVLTKCGLQYEGLMHNYYIVNNICCNRAMYAMTREDFFAQNPEYSKENWPTKNLVSQYEYDSHLHTLIAEYEPDCSQ